MEKVKPVNLFIGIIVEQGLWLIAVYIAGPSCGDLIFNHLLGDEEHHQVQWSTVFDLIGMAGFFLWVCENRIFNARAEISGRRTLIDWNYLRFFINLAGFFIFYLAPCMIGGLMKLKEVPLGLWLPLGIYWTVYYLRIEREVRSGQS